MNCTGMELLHFKDVCLFSVMGYSIAEKLLKGWGGVYHIFASCVWYYLLKTEVFSGLKYWSGIYLKGKNRLSVFLSQTLVYWIHLNIHLTQGSTLDLDWHLYKVWKTIKYFHEMDVWSKVHAWWWRFQCCWLLSECLVGCNLDVIWMVLLWQLSHMTCSGIHIPKANQSFDAWLIFLLISPLYFCCDEPQKLEH